MEGVVAAVGNTHLGLVRVLINRPRVETVEATCRRLADRQISADTDSNLHAVRALGASRVGCERCGIGVIGAGSRNALLADGVGEGLRARVGVRHAAERHRVLRVGLVVHHCHAAIHNCGWCAEGHIGRARRRTGRREVGCLIPGRRRSVLGRGGVGRGAGVIQHHRLASRDGDARAIRHATRTRVQRVGHVHDDIFPVVRVRHRDLANNGQRAVGAIIVRHLHGVVECRRAAVGNLDPRVVNALVDRPLVGAREARFGRLRNSQILADTNRHLLAVGLTGFADLSSVGVVFTFARHALLLKRVGVLERPGEVVARPQCHWRAGRLVVHHRDGLVRLVRGGEIHRRITRSRASWREVGGLVPGRGGGVLGCRAVGGAGVVQRQRAILWHNIRRGLSDRTRSALVKGIGHAHRDILPLVRVVDCDRAAQRVAAVGVAIGRDLHGVVECRRATLGNLDPRIINALVDQPLVGAVE